MNLFRVFVNLFKFNRTNWKAVALCFLAATVFWFFNAINKEYSTNLRFPIQFEFNNEKFVQAKMLPQDISLNVKGNGWDLLRSSSYGLKRPSLVIPIERPAEVKKIVCSTLPPVLASQMGRLQINYVVTDTLFLEIEPKDVHKFKAVVDEKSISYKEGFGRISPVVILPDSVHLEGPRSLLHDLPDSILLTYSGKKVGGNFRESIEVVTNNEMIKRDPPVVEVMFEVGEVITISRKVRLEITKPSFVQASLSSDSVSIQVQIPKDHSSDFQEKGITASVDLRGARKGTMNVRPVWKGLPPYAQVLRADSIAVTLF
mgnify:CR=1 FL=1